MKPAKRQKRDPATGRNEVGKAGVGRGPLQSYTLDLDIAAERFRNFLTNIEAESIT